MECNCAASVVQSEGFTKWPHHINSHNRHHSDSCFSRLLSSTVDYSVSTPPLTPTVTSGSSSWWDLWLPISLLVSTCRFLVVKVTRSLCTLWSPACLLSKSKHQREKRPTCDSPRRTKLWMTPECQDYKTWYVIPTFDPIEGIAWCREGQLSILSTLIKVLSGRTDPLSTLIASRKTEETLVFTCPWTNSSKSPWTNSRWMMRMFVRVKMPGCKVIRFNLQSMRTCLLHFPAGPDNSKKHFPATTRPGWRRTMGDRRHASTLWTSPTPTPTVEMHISFDMYHDRKENKNVDTFVFVQLYIISQHCLRHFKSHDFSLKLHSFHNHKCCPTSDVSLPDKRISPIRGAVREREYYCWEHPYFLSHTDIHTLLCWGCSVIHVYISWMTKFLKTCCLPVSLPGVKQQRLRDTQPRTKKEKKRETQVKVF